MTVYIVTGKLGTGKGKYCVLKMQKALLEGRRVVTNCDLFLENLLPSQSRQTALRLPDKPTPEDMLSIGYGYEGKILRGSEGLLVLDELGSWLNARNFQDKSRAGFLDWLIHARKYRWDCLLQVQDVDMIDKQARNAVCEYLVKCINMENLKIPVIGGLLGKYGKLPRMHAAQVSLVDVPGVPVDREFYKAVGVQDGYDTEQIFRSWARVPGEIGFDAETFMGPFSYLSPWHLKGRFEAVKVVNGTVWSRLFKPVARPPLKPKLPLVAKLAKLDKVKAWDYAVRLNKLGVV